MATRFPAKQDPLFNLLDLYNQKEDYGKVISTLNRIEEKTGKNEQITMEKFRIYLQMKDDKKAFEEIESLVNEYPMDYRYQVILGDVYMQNGKKQEAYDTYKKVLAENRTIRWHCFHWLRITSRPDRKNCLNNRWILCY